MAKRFRLRISRMFPSFHSCRTKDPPAAAAAADPVFKLSTTTPHPSPTLPPRHLLPRHVPVVSSTSCLCHSSTRSDRGYHPPYTDADVDAAEDMSSPRGTPAYLWRKEEKWHVVACVVNPPPPATASSSPRRRKIDSDDGEDLFPPLAIPKASYRESKREIRKRRKKKKSRSRARVSTSSADTRWFSSDEEDDDDEREYEEEYDYEGDETETLILSSRSFSTDCSSSDFNTTKLKPIHETLPRHRKPAKVTQHPQTPETATDTPSSPGRVSMSSVLKRLRLMSTCAAVEGKVRESFAVVKRSEDPYEDFKRSMVEMILEKQIYEEAELEELLRCFLSLNSGGHHATIVRAFSEIWDALLFPCSSSKSPVPVTVPLTPRF